MRQVFSSACIKEKGGVVWLFFLSAHIIRSHALCHKESFALHRKSTIRCQNYTLPQYVGITVVKDPLKEDMVTTNDTLQGSRYTY